MKRVFTFIFVTLTLYSCVGRSTYSGAVREIEMLEDIVGSLEDEKEELEWKVDELEERIEELEDIIDRAQKKVKDADWEIAFNDTFSASLSISDAQRILNEL